MALETNTYGLVVDIEALIGDIVPSKDFTGSTEPTEADVELALDAAAHEINRDLEVAGYAVPVIVGTDATAFAYLADINNYGACAIVLGMFPGTPYDPDEEAPPTSSRAGRYQARFNAGLKVIQEHKLKASMDVARAATRFDAGARLDSDGNERSPLFTRAMTDYPGSRSHTT